MRRVVAGIAVALFLGAIVWEGRAQTLPTPVLAPDKARLDQTLTGLDGPGFAIAAGGEFLMAACEEGTIQVWNKDVWMGVRNGGKTAFILRAHQGPVIALAARSAVLASAGIDGKVVLWDLSSGTEKQAVKPAGRPRCSALSPDGNLLVIAGEKNALELWDVATGKGTGLLEGHTDWVNALTFSPDGKALASGGQDGTVKIWDVVGKKQILTFSPTLPPPANAPPPPTNRVLSLAFSPDGKQLAVGGSDGLIHFANVTDGKIIRSLSGHTSSITGLTFHPGGKLLASASKDRTVRLWDVNGQALKTLEGHLAWVQGLVWLEGGMRLASVSADRTVKIWDLASSK